jgi:hypothetical protein
MPDKVSLDQALTDEKNYSDLIKLHNSDEKIQEAAELGIKLE